VKKIIIAAIAKNNVIGKSNGEMSWHIKEEFQHFKETTTGYPILMGRKTFQSLTKPLPNRENIIVSRNHNFKPDFLSTHIVKSIKEGIDLALTFQKEKVFIIGGGEIYRQALTIADEMILSHLNFDAEGDVLFPSFSLNDWKINSEEKRDLFTIVHYSKK